MIFDIVECQAQLETASSLDIRRVYCVVVSAEYSFRRDADYWIRLELLKLTSLDAVKRVPRYVSM